MHTSVQGLKSTKNLDAMLNILIQVLDGQRFHFMAQNLDVELSFQVVLQLIFLSKWFLCSIYLVMDEIFKSLTWESKYQYCSEENTVASFHYFM